MSMTVRDILRGPVAPTTRLGEVTFRSIDNEVRGPLQTIIDVMSAPLYGVANVADALLRGDVDVVDDLWRGLTLQERKTFIDVLKARGVPAAEVVGLVLDLGLDPMTYLGGLPYKALKAGWQTARATRTVDRFINAMKELSITDTLGRMFSTTWKKPREFVELRNTLVRALSDRQRQTWDEIMRFVAEVPEDERKLITEARTKPWLFQRLSPEGRKRAVEIYNKLDTYAVRGAVEGLWPASVAQKWIGKYVPLRFVERTPSLTITVGGKPTRPSFIYERAFETVDDAREFSKDIAKFLQTRTRQDVLSLADALDKKWKGKWFRDNVAFHYDQAGQDIARLHTWAKHASEMYVPHEDIAKSLLIYETEWHKYEAQSRFMKTALQKWGRPATKNVLPGPGEDVVHVPEFLQRAVGGEYFIAPKEIARDLNDLSHIFVTGGEASKMLRWFDRLTGNWKIVQTIWRLPFHIRNLYSNYFQLYLAGVKPADFYDLSVEALKVLNADNPKAWDFLAFRPTDVVGGLPGKRTYKELFDALRNQGILQTGFMSSELYTLRDVYAFLRGESAKWPRDTILRRALDMPAAVGRWVENSARVALHLDGLRRGMSDLEAGRRVFKYLFDYSDITPFEQQYLRRFVPFYTWIRKNIPLQIEHMLKTPEKYLKPARFIDAWNVMYGPGEEERSALPVWMRDLLWVPTGLKDEKGRRVYAYIDLPMQDVTRIVEFVREPERLWRLLHPVVDVALTATNVRMFPRAGLVERFPGDMEPAPAWVALLPEAVQRALGIEPIWDKKTRMMVLGAPKQRMRIINTIVPEDILGQLAQLFGDTRAIAVSEREPWAVASFVSGVRFRPVDMQEERRWRALERKQRLSWAVALARVKRRPLTQEELDDLLR